MKRKALLAMFAASSFAGISRASVVDATWLGGSGSWNDPTKWSTGVVPNNGANTYNVFVPAGTVTTSTAVTINSLDVGAGSGVVTFNNLVATNAIVNRGSIATAADVQTKLGFGSIQNLGTLEARGGYSQLEGTFTRADLGNVQWLSGQSSTSNNRFVLRGTFQNQNKVFNVGADERWSLGACVVNGGTINIDPAAVFNSTYITTGPIESATLNNVVINGKISFGAWTIAASNLLGNAEWYLGNANLGGTPSLGSAGTMTIASTVLVHGGGGDPFNGSSLGHAASIFGTTAIVNRGTVKSDQFISGGTPTGEFDINTPTFFNEGTLGVSSKHYFYATGDVLFRTDGVLDVSMTSVAGQGLLRVLGKLDLTTADDSLLLTANANMTPGTFYRIATTNGGVIGTFDSVSPGFEVMYTSTEIFARVVPEPVTLGAIMALAMSFVWNRRRRR